MVLMTTHNMVHKPLHHWYVRCFYEALRLVRTLWALGIAVTVSTK